MLVFVEYLLDVFVHIDVAYLFVVVPLEIDTTVQLSVPVCANFIVLAEN